VSTSIPIQKLPNDFAINDFATKTRQDESAMIGSGLSWRGSDRAGWGTSNIQHRTSKWGRRNHVDCGDLSPLCFRLGRGTSTELRLPPPLKPQSGAKAPQSIFPGPPPVDRSRTYGMLECWNMGRLRRFDAQHSNIPRVPSRPAARRKHARRPAVRADPPAIAAPLRVSRAPTHRPTD
jgi:hypothetical protein